MNKSEHCVALTNEYDTAGRVIKQTQADGSIYTFRYTLAGSAITQTDVTDPNGNTTTYRFNSRQYIARVVDANGQMTRFEQDFATNQLTAIIDPQNRKRSFTYDLNGNTTSVVDPAGNPTLIEYEPVFNRLIKITDALNQTTNFTYDTNGNLISTTDPLGSKTLRSYDTVSRLTGLTDANGKSTRYSCDVLNRVTQIEDAIAGLTQFTYDPNGNLLSVTDAKGQKTTYTYDVMDRLSSRVDPLLRTERYLYDLNGNLKTFTDRKGQVTSFTYDSLDRRSGTSFADGSSTAFLYDTVGKLTRLTDSVSGDIALEYDFLLDRLIRESTPSGTVEYAYDESNRRTEMTVNGQAPVSYGYDAASRLTRVGQGTQIVNLGYDAMGRRNSLSYSNGTRTSYSYDAASRLTNILHQSSVATIESLGYSYDTAGNRIGFTRAGQAATLLPEPVQAAYDAANEQIQLNNATPNLTYDANGNLISQTDATGITTYTWDARNRLIGISGPSVSASFVYDALGRRVSKTINGVRTDYQYDGNDIIAEIGGGAIGANYLRSLRVDEPFVRQGSSNEYYHADALGSTLSLTNTSGAITTGYTYEGFGKTTITGTSTNPLQYTGRENDGTGLYYYRARYYSPTVQRFLSEDPKECNRIKGKNLYVFVENNPINYIDPFGLDKEPSCPPDGCSGQSVRCIFSLRTLPTSLACLSICAKICLVGLSIPVIGQIPPAGPAVCAACYTSCAGNLVFNAVRCFLEEQECRNRCGPS